MVHPKSKAYTVPIYHKTENRGIMKTIYIVVLIILLTALMLRAQTPPFAGSGTSGDPYQISTPALFDSLRNPTWGGASDTYFILTADIDLSGYADWTPIPQLRGSLDGQWHTISNMTITSIPDQTSDVRVGLFAYTYMTNTEANTGYHNVHNLRIKNFTIDVNDQSLVNNEHHYVGLIAGYLTGVSSVGLSIYQVLIDSSFIKFNINQTQRLYVGGVAGLDNIGAVRRAKVTNTVIDTVYAASTLGTFAAGIIPRPASEIRECAFIGEIRKEIPFTYGGAIASYLEINAPTTPENDYGGVVDCYARGKQVNADGHIFSGLVGRVTNNNAYYMRYSYMQSDSNYAPPASDSRIYTGNLIGYSGGIYPKMYKTYWDITTDVGNKFSVGYPNGMDTTGTGIIDDSLKSETFLTTNGWNFTSTWKIDPAKNGGYPYLQWEDNIPVNNISVTSPLAGTYVGKGDSITVAWTGAGDFKNVIINDIDTFYTTTATAKIVAPTTLGAFTIKVVMLSDPTISDSTYVNVIADKYIDVYSVTSGSSGSSVNVSVITTGLDSIRFYIGNNLDTLTYVRDAHISPVLLDSTYNLTIPGDFHKTNDTLFVIVNEDDDTSAVSTAIPGLFDMGQPGQNTACWSAQNYEPIEVNGILDVGCGWVSGITTRYTTSSAIFDNDTSYIMYSYNACTAAMHSAGECIWSHRVFVAYDTSTSTYNDIRYIDVPQYNIEESGGGIIYNNRLYYIGADSTIYCNDLLNNVDSLVILDIRSYYSVSGVSGTVTHLVNPKLYLFEYSSNITDTLIYNGSFSYLNLPKLNTAKIAVYEPSGYQGLWYFDALQDPNPKTIVSDNYAYTGTVTIVRNYFRGIDPKMRK